LSATVCGCVDGSVIACRLPLGSISSAVCVPLEKLPRRRLPPGTRQGRVASSPVRRPGIEASNPPGSRSGPFARRPKRWLPWRNWCSRSFRRGIGSYRAASGSQQDSQDANPARWVIRCPCERNFKGRPSLEFTPEGGGFQERKIEENAGTLTCPPGLSQSIFVNSNESSRTVPANGGWGVRIPEKTVKMPLIRASRARRRFSEFDFCPTISIRLRPHREAVRAGGNSLKGNALVRPGKVRVRKRFGSRQLEVEGSTHLVKVLRPVRIFLR
jgi:hypothetical protein